MVPYRAALYPVFTEWLCTKSVQSRFITLNVHQMAPFVLTKL